jgi:hypothetical protein
MCLLKAGLNMFRDAIERMLLDMKGIRQPTDNEQFNTVIEGMGRHMHGLNKCTRGLNTGSELKPLKYR